MRQNYFRTKAVWVMTVIAVVVAGCTSVKRKPESTASLVQHREAADSKTIAEARRRFTLVLERTKREYDDYTAGKRNSPPMIDVLVISGGGDWGAFGAGFLKGWGRIPTSDPMARPKFDGVTGVSTGALIAPFAFIGDEESINTIDRLYRNPQKDWVRNRRPIYFLPNHLSFARVPGLERDVKSCVSPKMIAKIAANGQDGRILAVNTTSLDYAMPQVFFLVPEAERATKSGDYSRIYNIILASAGIPGVFPYRQIDGRMYVDGGVTSNIIYGGRLSEDDSLPAVWQELYPNVPIPKIRYWVIFNNQFRGTPTVVKAKWADIIQRSVELSTRSATLTAIRHLYSMAEVSRLKRNATVEVRTVSIPNTWEPPVPGVFVKETMNNLADLGEKMGADPSSWNTQPPPP